MNPAVVWPVIGVVAVICIGMRAAGPMILHDRELPDAAVLVIDALAPALLAGLIVVDLVGPHWHDLDWTMVPALPLAALLRWFRAPDLACVAAAMALTILLRAIT
jgi:hypothetical protein